MRKIMIIFFCFISTLFAQNSFNTQFIYESTPSEGEFLDMIVEDNYIYVINGNYLKIYEFINENSISLQSQLNIFSSDSSPIKLLKHSNKIVVLFRSNNFPDNNQGGIKIFELDANKNIIFLSKFDVNGFKYDMEITEKYIFIAAGESGLFIIDYQNPSLPKLSGRYNPGGYSIGNGIIDVSVFANIVSVAMFSEGLDIIDIANVAEPQKLCSMFNKGDYVKSSLLIENYLFVLLQNKSNCEIYNITDLQNIKFESSIPTFEFPRDVSLQDKYLFISEYGTQIIDVNDKSNPYHVGFTSLDDLNLSHCVNGSKIFVAPFFNDGVNYRRKLKVYSFSNTNSKINIVEPITNNYWLSGETKSIDISAYNVKNINIDISVDNGTNWKKVIENKSISGYHDQISFNVPKVQSLQSLLKVSDKNKLEVFDLTTNPIDIKRVKLISPLSGTYENNLNIKWETNDLDTISLYYSLNDGMNWNIIFEKLIDQTNNFERNYTWLFENLNSDNTRIKIENYNDHKIYEISPKITLRSKVEILDSIVNGLDFFPLSVGNTWIFKRTNASGSSGIINSGFDSIKVISDTIINNQKYYNLNWLNNETIYYSYNVANKSIERYYENESQVAFELDSQSGECWLFENTNLNICNEGIFEEIIFENVDTVMHLNQYYYCKAFNLVKGIGPSWISIDESYQTIDYKRYDLKYAKINGNEYGTPVAVNNNYLPFSKEFQLTQNYPNPFNPSTIIKYTIPSSSVMLNSFQYLNESEIPKQVREDNLNVALKVYDILGKELTILVNKKQAPGNYQVEFDGNNLPSGVYFYRLQINTPGQADNFVETKKMVLLR